MKNVIITGATGMIGRAALERCLARSDVNRVTAIVRRPLGLSHEKLVEVVHKDFLDFSPISEHFENQDACLFCLGVYSGAVPKKQFREITVDYTRAFAATLKQYSPASTFCFLSGQGADRSERSLMMFARDKGAAENLLLEMGFSNTHCFRPGYIYPVEKRREPNLSYRVTRSLYRPFLSKIYPNIGIDSTQLADGMVEVALNGGGLETFENRDIKLIRVKH